VSSTGTVRAAVTQIQGLHLHCYEVVSCQLHLMGPYSTLQSWAAGAAAVQQAERTLVHLPGGCGAYRSLTAVPTCALKPGSVPPVPIRANLLHQTS